MLCHPDATVNLDHCRAHRVYSLVVGWGLGSGQVQVNAVVLRSKQTVKVFAGRHPEGTERLIDKVAAERVQLRSLQVRAACSSACGPCVSTKALAEC
jgi:hypothetical protein